MSLTLKLYRPQSKKIIASSFVHLAQTKKGRSILNAGTKNVIACTPEWRSSEKVNIADGYLQNKVGTKEYYELIFQISKMVTFYPFPNNFRDTSGRSLLSFSRFCLEYALHPYHGLTDSILTPLHRLNLSKIRCVVYNLVNRMANWQNRLHNELNAHKLECMTVHQLKLCQYYCLYIHQFERMQCRCDKEIVINEPICK